MSRTALRMQSALAASSLALTVSAAGVAHAVSSASPDDSRPSVSPVVRVSGTSPFADCPFGDDSVGGVNYPGSEAEPSVAVDPTNPHVVVGAFQQDPWSTRGAHGLVASHTSDGGVTWALSWATFSQCAGGDFERASNPWVSIGVDGTVYEVAHTTLRAIQVATSSDHGVTWNPPTTLISDPPFTHANDKPSVTADPYRPATAYVVWHREEFPNDSASSSSSGLAAVRGRAYLSTTSDAGRSWSSPRDITPQLKNLYTFGHQLVIEPDGALVDVFSYSKGSGSDVPNETLIGVSRSTDGGATWTKVSRLASALCTGVADPTTGAPIALAFGCGVVDVAVDPGTGRLYAVWDDGRFSGGSHNDIALASSTDEGGTWSTSIKVNRTPGPNPAFSPQVDVLPDGTIGVSYYDLRNDDTATDLRTDYFLTTSPDHGETWTETRLTPTSFDTSRAPVRRGRGYFLGDYQGLAHTPTAFVAMFTQSDTSNDTHIYAATITP